MSSTKSSAADSSRVKPDTIWHNKAAAAGAAAAAAAEHWDSAQCSSCLHETWEQAGLSKHNLPRLDSQSAKITHCNIVITCHLPGRR
jgi:hypothetical protein